MPLQMRCPKCGGPMEKGRLRDAEDPAKRAGGAVQAGWFGAGGESYPVTAYRCEGCGYLESYARPHVPEE